MAAYIVEVKIVEPGRPVGVYRPAETEQGTHLTLEALHIPHTPVPLDRAVVVRSLTVENTPVPVLVMGTSSHPPGTHLLARVLGGVVDAQGIHPPILLAVPHVDEPYTPVEDVDHLDDAHKAMIRQALKADMGEELLWLSREDVWPQVQEAQRAYRMAVSTVVEDRAHPLWRPPAPYRGRLAFARLEHYTEAEYTFFQLPRRFQEYITSHLAGDERILYALWRPRFSRRTGGLFWRRQTVHEGVLILTDQRLLHLTELVPPDSAGVRYGFFSHMGVLERLQDIGVQAGDGDILFLQARWRTARGAEETRWAFPHQTQDALMNLLPIVRQFTPGHCGPYALRRANVPPPPETLAPLLDPAANDPEDVERLTHRFRRWIDQYLDEPVHAWALLPAWAHDSGVAHVLLVTPHALWDIPDPGAASLAVPRHRPLADIGTLIFQDSILNAYVEMHVPERAKTHSVRLSFPYGSMRAFHTLTERMRRCMVAQAV